MSTRLVAEGGPMDGESMFFAGGLYAGDTVRYGASTYRAIWREHPTEGVRELHLVYVEPVTGQEGTGQASEERGMTDAELWDALEAAWGIIANAGGGNWDKESPEWQDAAFRWRDRYLQHLGRHMAARAQDRKEGAISPPA